MRDYYEDLGIARTAGAGEIRTAFKRLAKLYHPDRNPANKEAEELFKVINEAYHTLSNSAKKGQYDLKLYGLMQVYNYNYNYNDLSVDEIKKNRYYRWKQTQERRYKFDKNYFRIQGLAFLVFLIIAGFCFSIIHTAHYYVRKQQLEKYTANNQYLKKVDGLFGSEHFDDAFKMIYSLEEKDPLEYRFSFAKDSLVDALRKKADLEFRMHDFSAAISHYQILKNHEHPIRYETLQNISMCQYYLGNYAESLQALKHLHNQDPHNLALIYQIGMINMEKIGNAEEALHYFTLGKKLFKQNLSHVYGSAFQIVMNPSDAPDIYYHVFLARAQANFKLQNYKDAITDCNWAIFLRRDQADPYYLRAMAAINLNDMRNVCEDLTKAKQFGIMNIDRLKRRHCFQ